MVSPLLRGLVRRRAASPFLLDRAPARRFAAAPLEADASATERFMERALAAPGTTSVPRADAAPPGSSTGEPIDAVGAELTDSSSDDEAEGG